MNVMNSEIAFLSAFACSSAVFTSRGAGNDRLELATSELLRDAVLRRDGDRREAVLTSRAARLRDREDGERRAAERLDVAVLRDADDLERPHGAVRGDADRVADLEVLVLRRVGVDDDLVAGRPPSGRRVERERVEARLRRVDAEAERRAPPWSIALPSLPISFARVESPFRSMIAPAAAATFGCARIFASSAAGTVALPLDESRRASCR